MSDRSAHRIPIALTTIVGRQADVGHVKLMLSGARLVTLVGPPGVGKTRLAQQIAQTAPEEQRTSVVELGRIVGVDEVLGGVAEALDVKSPPRGVLEDAVAEDLDDGRRLLVLDNCEHVIDGAAEVATMLLERCPRLRVLATSRELLDVPVEAVWRVAPLPVPSEATDDPDALLGHPSVALFVERARAIEPRFALTPETAPAVAAICRQLDGLPLAIELAAARVGLLSVHEILSHLDDRAGLLSTSSRRAPTRQRSLQAALDWSHDLLSDDSRTLLRRLAVFAGGFTLVAATRVVSGAGLYSAGVLRGLSDLVAKSLVQAETGGEQARYRMLESIREYAAEQLASAGEDEAVRRAFADWAIEFAEDGQPELTRSEQATWLARLDAERDNLRAALRWLVAAGESEDALRLGGALTLYWHIRGDLAEGAERLGAALARATDAPAALRATGLWGEGFLRLYLGDLPSAEPLILESVAIARADDDRGVLARALSLHGDLLMLKDPLAARPVLDEAIALARSAGDVWCLADSLAKQGWSHLYQGDTIAARPQFEECLALAREHGDLRNMRRGFGGVGWTELLEGDLQAATAALDDSLDLARRLGDVTWIAQILNGRGELARLIGDHDAARASLAEGLEHGRAMKALYPVSLSLGLRGRVDLSTGDVDAASGSFDEALEVAGRARLKSFVAWWLHGRGDCALAQGDPAAAHTAYREALALSEEIGNRRDAAAGRARLGRLARAQNDLAEAIALLGSAVVEQLEVRDRTGATETLEALAGTLAAHGRPEQATRVWAAADARRAAVGHVRAPAQAPAYVADLALARDLLGETDFDEHWRRGAELTLEEAAGLATRGRGSRQRPLQGWASLTPAERDVAVLAAGGLTNAAIAERLYVSPRTVKTHLEHVYAKLGIDSRKAIAEHAPIGATARVGG